jgi:hypothetical protein
MNITNDIQCIICSTNNGFSSADLRSIIVLVVLTSIALAVCYVGVLLYAIRTRFVPEKTSNVIVHNNDAFKNGEELYEDFVQPIDNSRQATTTTTPIQQVRFAVENELVPTVSYL